MNKSGLLAVFYILLVCQSVFAVDLVSDGNAAANIVVPADADKVMLFAASELQKYIEQISTVKLAIEQSPKSKTAIYLGRSCSNINSDLPPKSRYNGDDNFIIRTVGNNICIAGCSPRATLFAVYAFLEELGCCWPLPGKEYEVIPKLQKISWSQNEIKSEPAIAGRGMIFVYFNDERDQVLELIDWSAKNRFNFIYLCSGKIPSHRWPEFKEAFAVRDMGLEWGMHWLSKYLPRDLFKEHPEYFRMENGKRTEKLNMCPSSPEAADIIARNSIGDWNELRDYGRFEALHLWPDDLDKGGWCSCDKCKGLTASDQSLNIINEVAKRLPLGDTSLVHVSYHTTITAPNSIKPAKNVRLLYAPRERCYKHAMGECPINRTYLEYLKSQIPMFPNKPEIFEYYHDLILFRDLPMPLHPIIGKDIKAYRQAGVAGIGSLSFGNFSKWAYGPNYYVLGKCLWRGEGNPRDIEEYCNAVYGPQSKAMQQYFDLLFELCGTVMQLCDYNMGADMRYPRTWELYAKKHASLLAPMITDEHLDKIERTLKDAIAVAAEPYRKRMESQLLLWQFARLEVPATYRIILAGNLNANLGQDANDTDRLNIIALYKKAIEDMENATQILASAPKQMQYNLNIDERRKGFAGPVYANSIKSLEEKLKPKQLSTQPETKP